MINKKLVGTALVGLMTVGFAGQVSANQTIDGANGQTEGKVKVTGNLGAMDNTDPGEVLPDGDDKWINVSLPTAVVFGSSDKETIISPNYTITNNSGRPVKVDVQKYEIKDGTGIEALQKLELGKVNNPEEKIILAENGASLITGAGDSKELDDSIASKGTLTFGFSGLVDASNLPEEGKQATINSELVFKFKSVKINE